MQNEVRRKPVFIIAEIGINHNGDLDTAKKLIDGAVEAGADAVKFQKRTIDIVYTKELLDSPRESPWGATQRAQKEGLEFGEREYDIINTYCKEKGIAWFASAWDVESQKFLRKYNLKYNKIASAMLTYKPLLEMVADERKHTFISTGMSSLEEIEDAVNIFRKKNCPFELMHCNSTYPSKEEDLNLHAMALLRERFGCDVGYSGHEVGIISSVAAAALGAASIERHITLDRAMYGSDQAASVEVVGFRKLSEYIRSVERSLGNPVKVVMETEKPIRQKLRWFAA